jgi:hypothetical protein
LSGGVETYAGSSWLSVGTTDATGEASQELLTASYTFRVNYAGATLSKVQDIGANPLVVFNTVNVSVTLADAQGQLYAGGIITYAGSSWLSFGTSVSTGPVYKELLPTSYTFRMVYAGTTTSKVQDVSQNQAVGFLK